MEDNIICPFKAEAYISHIDTINAYVSKIMTKNGTHMPDEEEMDKLIKIFTVCCKDECAAWNGGYCARIFKGGKD